MPARQLRAQLFRQELDLFDLAAELLDDLRELAERMINQPAAVIARVKKVLGK